MDAEKPTPQVRVVLIPKDKTKFSLPQKKRRFTQGRPIELFIKITNIGKTPTPILEASEFELRSKSDNVAINSHNTVVIQQLNPNESIELSIDKMTIGFKGAAWASLQLTPVSGSCEIQTYQYDCDHEKDEPHTGEGSWGDLVYVQGELEILQHKTNSLILILTIATVVHSIFGMKEALKFIVGLAYHPLLYVASFLGAIAK